MKRCKLGCCCSAAQVAYAGVMRGSSLRQGYARAGFASHMHGIIHCIGENMALLILDALHPLGQTTDSLTIVGYGEHGLQISKYATLVQVYCFFPDKMEDR